MGLYIPVGIIEKIRHSGTAEPALDDSVGRHIPFKGIPHPDTGTACKENGLRGIGILPIQLLKRPHTLFIIRYWLGFKRMGEGEGEGVLIKSVEKDEMDSVMNN